MNGDAMSNARRGLNLFVAGGVGVALLTMKKRSVGWRARTKRALDLIVPCLN
jgi:hypothetical protein